MLWLVLSGFCVGLAYKEVRRPYRVRPGFDAPDRMPIHHTFVAVMLAAAFLLALPPLNHTLHERHLEQMARALAGVPHLSLHCNTYVDSMLDRRVETAGHADVEGAKVVMQVNQCSALRDYLSKPAAADRKALYSLAVLVHEAMHIRGERDEAKTECQAAQRLYQAALLAGADEEVAQAQTRLYFKNHVVKRFGAQQRYFTPECKRGGALDEKLPGAPWPIEGGL